MNSTIANQALPASYLTHELRAPITSIRLGLEILQEQTADRLAADERQMLTLAMKNTSRLEGLVNDILDYSRMMAGVMKVEKRSCGAHELMDEAIEGLAAMACAHNIRLIKEAHGPLPRVSAEGRRVVQVLTNLISNAIKFTPEGGTVTVRAALGRRESAGMVVFSVTDTGRGVPAKDIGRIFEMFQSSGRVKQTEGTGLGLTLARLMVQLHGGRIWAEEGRAAGASFCFTIPVAHEDSADFAQAPAKSFDYVELLSGIGSGCHAFLAFFL